MQAVPQTSQRIDLAVGAELPIERVWAYARECGWRNLHLHFCGNNSGDRDDYGEDEEGAQWPALSGFARWLEDPALLLHGVAVCFR